MQQQYAILIDYGYVRATLARVYKSKPIDMDINIHKLCCILEEKGKKYGSGRLLRFYFYDGAVPYTEMSAEHVAICKSDNITLKLGQLRRNPDGQYRQKGVDGLIVTDLLSLAQNRAISDAFILGGDEDLVLGLVYAKAMGVRLHLMSINTGENNVAIRLIEEADTHIHLINTDINQIVRIKKSEVEKSKTDTIDKKIEEYFTSITQDEKEMLATCDSWKIPGPIDSQLGGIIKGFYGIIPDYKEKKKYARQLITLLAKKK